MYLNRIQRLLKIINLINNKKGLTRKKLASLCGKVSIKTISRDINTLRMMGYDLIYDHKEGYKFINHDFLSVNQNFASIEILLLISSLRANKTLSPDLIINIENKLISLLPERAKENLNKLIDTTTVNDIGSADFQKESEEILSKLERAISERRKVKFDYSSAGSAVDKAIKSHKVIPYSLIWQRDRCYLLGDLVYKDFPLIHYRLDRITNLKLLGESGSPPSDFDVGRYLAETWKMFSGRRVKVKIKFHEEVKHIFENRVSPLLEKKVERLDNHHYLFVGHIRGTEGLKTDLLALGNKCEVLEPNWLREKLKEMAQQVLESYQT